MSSSSFDSTELPVLQPRSHCVLIPRDPNFIYAYWNYTDADIDHARQKLGHKSAGAKLILRVYDISHIEFDGSNAIQTWDLDVGLANNNAYVQVWKDNTDYCAELGLCSGEDLFIPLMRSNIARTPPKASSHRNDLIWQDINDQKVSAPFIEEERKEAPKPELQKAFTEPNVDEGIQHLEHPPVEHAPGLAGQAPVIVGQPQEPQTVSSSEPVEDISPAKSQISFHMVHAKPSKKARTYFLTAQDIRDYYMELFAKMSKKGRKRARDLSIEHFLKGKLKDVSWQKVRPILTAPELLKGARQAASMGLTENQGASENLLNTGASEGRLNSRKFFFEVWTELVVHGRTEPDASVWLNQMGVKLNPDGTFSLRYALPEGEIPLKFIALSSDAIEQRLIYTSVAREKTVVGTKLLEGSHG